LKDCENEINDTLKFKKYRKILSCFYKVDDFENAEKVIFYLKETSNKLTYKYKDSIYYSRYLAEQATFYYYKGDVNKSLEYLHFLLGYNLRNSNEIEIANSYGNLGILYRKLGNYPKAIYYIQESIKRNEANKRNELAGNFANLANVYNDLGQFKKAGEYLFKTLKLRITQNDDAGIALCYSNIGNYYSQIGINDSAIIYYFKTIFYYDKIKIQNSKKVVVYLNLTNQYIKSEKFDSVVKYLDITQKLLNEKSNPFHLSHFYENKGDLHKKLKNYKDAINCYNYALKYSSLNDEIKRYLTLYNSKSFCFYKLKILDSAYNNKLLFEKYIEIIYNDSKASEITKYEMQYKFDKEQEEIKTKQFKKDIETQNTIKRKQIVIYTFLFALTLLLILVIIVFKNNKQRKKDNALLQQKNDQIETQKKDIIDSINYAERIQRSFLATTEQLNKNLKEFFIFFKPKSIVSGDFYWAATSSKERQGWTFVFCTADSTGHGVPGAIMSLLNITSLEKAIETATTPDKILNLTRKTIIERLKKDGSAEGGKDGMDCSLLVFDFNNLKLQIAAANNPVWIVREIKNDDLSVRGKSRSEDQFKAYNSTFSICEIKPDKMPVGKHDKQDVPFTLHEVTLQKGDVVYTLTDGFPDQFGGEKGKKYMIKNLRELIVTIAHLPMHEQKQVLENTFNTWKGNSEQVDDVTVIGIRV
jgi:serine phosphatase RsbU (regulator of sigma subunit)